MLEAPEGTTGSHADHSHILRGYLSPSERYNMSAHTQNGQGDVVGAGEWHRKVRLLTTATQAAQQAKQPCPPPLANMDSCRMSTDSHGYGSQWPPPL